MKGHLIFIYSCLLMGWNSAFADLYIITAQKTPIETIQLDDLRNLYLGRTKFVQNNMVQLVDHLPDQELYLKLVVHKSEYSYRSLWKMRIFTGKSKAPTKTNTLNELIQMVTDETNAIAYVSSFTPNDHPQIKVLKHFAIP